MHDAMLTAIFKARFDDFMSDMNINIYKTKKDCAGLEILAIIEFRSLPLYVKDKSGLRSRYKISGYKSVFHYKAMIVSRRLLVARTVCHDTSPGRLEQMCLSKVDEQHRQWIHERLHSMS